MRDTLRWARRQRLFERLELRVVLNAMPVALDDPWYYTAEDTTLVIGTSDTTLLDNDWDPEGSALTASVVAGPAHGTLISFDADGTFEYEPDTSFVGWDTFTYKVSDGTSDSAIVTATIAVGGHFGPRTNLEERTRDARLLTGELELRQPLTPGLSLIYDSNTLPTPIIVLETFLQTSSDVPDAITAQLTFNATAGTAYGYDTTGLDPGDTLRFALQVDATSLATGHYDYTVKLTADMDSTLVDHIYAGAASVVNRGASTHPFGRGWQLAGLDELVIDSGGVLWVQDDGDALWFAEDGSGGFERAAGDVTFSTLSENLDDSFTLTDKHGHETHFDSDGRLTSRVDRNGNTVTFTYTSGLLTKITDPFARETTLAYTSDRLTSVTDFAGRTATLTYDGSGRLTSIVQPDPDGEGEQTSPVTEFAYDVTSHRLTTVTNPREHNAVYSYGTHGRLTSVNFAGTSTLTALQTIGLPTGTSGNSLTAASPTGSTTDQRSKTSTFRVDAYGQLTEWTDPLGQKTQYARNTDGLLVRLTQPDPDGAGPLSKPVTTLGYDELGNLVYRQSPRGYSSTRTYTTFNLVATSTDEVGNVTSFTYDGNGNLTALTDPDDFEWSYEYDAGGRIIEMTAPDPDGGGPLAAPVTGFAFDAYGRLEEITHPDETVVTFAYDAADNRTSVVDELENETTFVYDALNRLTSVTDRESATTLYAYNAIGLVTKITDALDNKTTYEYHTRGWVTKITQPDPDGEGDLTAAETTYTYDATGNVTAINKPSFEGLVQLRYEYDDVGRRTMQDGPGVLSEIVTEYAYDHLGRLTKIIDPLGSETRYAYDSSGNTTKVMQVVGALSPPYDVGPATLYVYDAAERLTDTTDPRGHVTSYTYNARGLVSTVLLPDPDGAGPLGRQPQRNIYDGLGRLIATEDNFCRVTTYAYDSRGRVVTVTQPDPDWGGPLTAPVTDYAYDDAGRLTSVTDPLNRVTSYAYDNEGRVFTVTLPDPDGGGPLVAPETTRVYNALGLLTSQTDPLGGVTTYAYDNLQRVTIITLPDPDDTGPLEAPEITYVYNARGKLDTIIDPLGRETTYEYDDLGRRTAILDDSGNRTSFEYNKLDQLTKITQPDPDDTGPLTAPITTNTYGNYHRLTKTTNPENGETWFTYDDAGNLLTLRDPENNVTTYAYDGLGQVTMETNELGDSRSYYYDSLGRVSRRVDRNERVVQFEYDGLDRIATERWFDEATPVPSISITTSTDGGLTDEVQRVGFGDDMVMLYGGTFTLTFDGQTTGSLAYNADAAAVQTALEGLSNMAPGDVTVVKLQEWDPQEWRLTFTGDLAGTNVAQVTVNTSNVWGMGTITAIEATDTTGGASHDEVQVVTLSNADGGTFRLAFLGQTAQPLDQDATAGEVETALEALTSVDNVTVTGSAGGPWTVTFVGTHSGVNQVTLNGDAAALTSGTPVRTISYAYDAASQLIETADADSVYAYTYDNLGRVLTVDNDGTPGVPQVVLTSAYNNNGNRTSLSAEIDSADDFLNSYTYDALNRLTRVDQDAVGLASVAAKRVDFAYNAIGQFTSIARFNDIAGGSGDEIATSLYSYDSLGRLTGLTYEQNSTDLFDPYAWTYDDLGRITQFVSADGTSDYEYDKTSQLTVADHDYQTNEAYSYDANGNRTMTGYSTGDNNQLLNDGTYSYTYDDEGNRLTRTNGTTDEVTEYVWDHRNRLTRVTEKDEFGVVTQVVAYTYDVFNRRIAKAVDTTSPFNLADAAIERYVYDDRNGVASIDGGNVILDFVDPDGDGASEIELVRRYLYGHAVDQLLAQENVEETISAPERISWPLVDHLGTVRDLIDNGGTLAANYEYDSFGRILSGDTSLIRYLYTSREHDSATGLQYNRARWYDAEVGRWISEDPIGFAAGDVNLQRYSFNSPLQRSDPSGLFTLGGGVGGDLHFWIVNISLSADVTLGINTNAETWKDVLSLGGSITLAPGIGLGLGAGVNAHGTITNADHAHDLSGDGKIIGLFGPPGSIEYVTGEGYDGLSIGVGPGFYLGIYYQFASTWMIATGDCTPPSGPQYDGSEYDSSTGSGGGLIYEQGP